MFRVKIESESIDIKEGNKNGNDWEIRSQQAYIFLFDSDGKPKAYPTEITVQLRKNRKSGNWQEPYKIGEYNLPLNSIYVGRFGVLSISTNNIEPIAPAKGAKV